MRSACPASCIAMLLFSFSVRVSTRWRKRDFDAGLARWWLQLRSSSISSFLRTERGVMFLMEPSMPYFGSGKALRILGEFLQIEGSGVLRPSFEVYAEYLFPFVRAREVHEKHLVVTAFSPEFGREVFRLVRRGYDENRFFFVLKPRDESPEHPQLGSGIALKAGYPSEGLVYLVYPHDAGAYCLGKLYATAYVFFGFADRGAEEPSDVHSKERQVPYAGQRLATEALAGIWNL